MLIVVREFLMIRRHLLASRASMRPSASILQALHGRHGQRLKVAAMVLTKFETH